MVITPGLLWPNAEGGPWRLLAGLVRLAVLAACDWLPAAHIWSDWA